MKKVMIAVAIVCAAVMAQAATAKWAGSNIYVPGSTTDKASGYLVYFVQSSDYALADAQASLADANIDFLGTYGIAGTAQASGATAGTIGTSFGNSETVTGYLVILNSSTIDDATLAYITGEASKATGASGQQATLAFGSLIGTQDAANWAAVPEPTSGLLMLVGLAGLALRRRRA